MTKKEYMMPTLEVVKIQTATMLATSDITVSGLDDVDFDVNGGDPSDAGARFFDDGDDWTWSAE